VPAIAILAATGRNFKHILGLARAAKSRGVDMHIFMTGRGVRLSQEPEFKQLLDLAQVGFCRVSLLDQGIDPDRALPDVDPRNITNQSRHADLLDLCDKYLVL
jgi:predicted peroxiredoxin